MAVDTLFVPPTFHPVLPPRWRRRAIARLRLWRRNLRREIDLAGLESRQRTDIGRPAVRTYRWLDELMRGASARH